MKTHKGKYSDYETTKQKQRKWCEGLCLPFWGFKEESVPSDNKMGVHSHHQLQLVPSDKRKDQAKCGDIIFIAFGHYALRL